MINVDSGLGYGKAERLAPSRRIPEMNRRIPDNRKTLPTTEASFEAGNDQPHQENGPKTAMKNRPI